jgi:excisionase family DNA binding protein
LLRTKEVAELWAVDPATVLRKVKSGLLPAIRLSRRGSLRFRVEDVEAFTKGPAR